jgi:hypothetical protein
MAITRYNPNTVFLGGDRTQVNDLAASAAITPGHLIERFNNAGVIRWRKHATAGGANAAAVATDQAMMNKSVDDDYAANDLVEASILHKGATAWMFIASGQNITAGQKLESAGDGTLRALASGVALFTALENKPNVLVLTRIRVEAL